MSGRPGWWFLLVLVIATLAVKLIVLAQLRDHPLLQPVGEMDPGYYVTLARQVAAGDWGAGDRVFFVSPLYIYFLALVFLVSGGSVLVAQAVQVLLGTVAVVLVWQAAREWLGTRAAAIAGSLAAATGYFTFNEVLVLQSSLDPFLTALAVWTLGRACRRGGTLRWAAPGLAFGVHALNRPNVLLAAVVIGAGAVWLAWRMRAGARSGADAAEAHHSGEDHRHRAARGWRLLVPAAAFAGGLLAALLPAAVRNAAVAGEFALVSSHGGLNFYIGNHPGADGMYRHVEGITPSIAGQDRDARRLAEAAEGRALTDSEVSGHFYRRAWEWMRQQPAAAVALFARKLFLTFNAVEVTLNYSYAYYSRDEPTALRALVVGPWLLLPLGIFGWLVAGPSLLRASPASAPQRAATGAARADLAPWWVWTSFIPAYAVAVALFFVSGRYRLPLLVALCIAAPASVTWLARAVAAGRRSRAALGLAVLAIVGIATNWPTGLDTGRSAEREAMILSLVDDGRHEEARALLARTEPAHPEPVRLLTRVALAWLQRSEPAEAVAPLERVASLGGASPDTEFLLGRALLDAGRPADAVPHLRVAVDALVSPAARSAATVHLARALVASARQEEARVAIRRLDGVSALDARTVVALAQLALDVREPRLAVEAAHEAVARAPRDAAARETLGLAFALAGERDRAIAALETACDLEPASASARLNLAALYAEAGRFAEARARATEALALRPDYGRARQLLAALPR